MNRNDRRVLIVTIITGVLILLGIFLLGEDTSSPGKSNISGNPRDSRHTRYSRDPGMSYTVPVRQPETFYFDPNTADSTQLLRLGLQSWQVRNIYKYRARGGVYRKKEDFARLYGLTVKDYRRLEPYIRISEDYLPAVTLVRKRGGEDKDDRNYSVYSNYSENKKRDSVRYPVKLREGEHLVLNTADTSLLRQVPGIGSYYAKEIVRYGKWLGGYVSVDQLDEIDHFPKESKKYFVITHANPRKLNVNKLSIQQLRRHPYINFYQAKAITDYRRLHGDIKSLNDLRFSSDFTEADIRRLIPYVEY